MQYHYYFSLIYLLTNYYPLTHIMIHPVTIAKFKAKIARNEFFNSIITGSAITIEKHFFKFNFSITKYKLSLWIDKDIEVNLKLKDAKKCIYIFWTGNNEMSDRRKYGVQKLKDISGVDIIVVSPTNLKNYILDDFPLHPAYEFLSLVHKSDYLRCYFMYHHGGGYSDVKATNNSWLEAFETLNNSNFYVLGYREILGGIARIGSDPVLTYDLRRYYFKNLGVCSFIFKPKSPIAKEWLNELNSRLDGYLPTLKVYPGNVLGDNLGYPIQWTMILSQILHPIFLKYQSKILQNNDIKPSITDYR